MDYNIILDTDSYKTSHWLQYDPDIVKMESYIESRGGDYDRIVAFGLQYIIKKYLSKPITIENIDEAEEEYTLQGLPFNREGWEHILNEYNGFIPVRILSLPEGTVIKNKNVMAIIESTDAKTFWVVGWLEDLLLRVWYPNTVASKSFHNRVTIQKYVNMTSDDPNSIYYKLHDFGARAATSYESSMIGSASHLINFMGTDTIAGHKLLRTYYGASGSISGSAVASEHSTITSWGRSRENLAYKNMLEMFANPKSKYKVPFFACVSDAYDIFNAVENIWGKELKGDVIGYGSTLVIRPDSGDPLYMVMMTISKLDAIYGHTVNSKGYKVLKNVRVIQGDGVDDDQIESILSYMEQSGYSSDNIVFGMGGALHQKLNRDTLKFALKCSIVYLKDGTTREVYKDPITDKGKLSKKGKLDLVKIDGEFVTLTDGVTPESMGLKSELVEFYNNGTIFCDYKLDEIRSFIDSEVERILD